MGKSTAGRIRWIAAFALLLLTVSAVPVLADSPPLGESQMAGASVPLPDAEDIAEALEGAEREEGKRERELETPASDQERKASQHAYEGLAPAEAEQLLSAQFPAQLAGLNADPARFLSDATLDQPLGKFGARVTDPEGETQLLESGIPVRAEDKEGILSPDPPITT